MKALQGYTWSIELLRGTQGDRPGKRRRQDLIQNPFGEITPSAGIANVASCPRSLQKAKAKRTPRSSKSSSKYPIKEELNRATKPLMVARTRLLRPRPSSFEPADHSGREDNNQPCHANMPCHTYTRSDTGRRGFTRRKAQPLFAKKGLTYNSDPPTGLWI